MIYLLIIFLELLILFLLSKIIPTLLTASFRYFIRSHKVSVWIFSFLYLPGTFVHEMAHLLTAGILLVPVGGISLLPELKENGVKLGHVQIQKTDPIRRTLIGFAPVFLGLISLAGIIFYFNKEFLEKGEYSLVVISVVIYLVLVIGNTMFSSRKDMEGALSVMIVFASVFGGGVPAGVRGGVYLHQTKPDRS
jgi:hypothetical protein